MNKIVKQREILASKDYFFSFDICQQISYLLNTFSLKSSSDNLEKRKVFKKVKDQKANVVTLSAFVDGVPIYKNNTQLWFIFFRINDLDCKIEKSIFLHSAYLTTKKPDPEFFFSQLINDLNNSFQNGIYVQNLDRKVHPALTTLFFDLGCKSKFINTVNFNTSFGCFNCLQEGERIKVGKGSGHVYPYEENVVEMSDVIYNECLFKIEKGFEASGYMGINGRSVWSKLCYIHITDLIAIEPMHFLFCGHLKRSIISSISFSNRDLNCYLNKESQSTINKRINRLSTTSIIKRTPMPITKINDWKTNQVFDFFYVLFFNCF